MLGGSGVGAAVKFVEPGANPKQVPPVMAAVTRPPPTSPCAVVGREPTAVVAVAELFPLFPSEVAEETVAVLVSPAVTEAPTCTVSVKTALLTPSEAMEQETLPLAPTAGVVHDQPPGEDRDTKVVPAGRGSDSETDAALLGPALFTVIV